MQSGHRLCYKCAAKGLAFDPSARVSQSVYITKHWVQGVVLGFLWGKKDFYNQVNVKILIKLNSSL